MAIRRYVVWVDANGYTRLALLNGNAGLGAVQAALAAQSNAAPLNCVESALTVYTPAPPGGVYRTVGDAAILTYQDAGGDLVDITLPAPLASVFLADGQTVDSAAIAAVSAAVIGTVVTGAGNPVTAYVAGTRRTKKMEGY